MDSVIVYTPFDKENILGPKNFLFETTFIAMGSYCGMFATLIWPYFDHFSASGKPKNDHTSM